MRKTWTCPGCRRHVAAIATEVRHRCPNRRNRWTDWQPATEDTP